jgi:ATP-dependent Lon protease
MSNDPDESEDFNLPLEEDVVSTGAAADSAEVDEKLKTLPRLLRYAILSGKDSSFAHARLVAEIAELVPSLPTMVSWANDPSSHFGSALAIELDRLAVAKDQPDLRTLADCVRLLALPLPNPETGIRDHRRVAKALLHALEKLPANTDRELAADIEAISFGWAALPAATDFLSDYHLPTASPNAHFLGNKMARRRLAAAKAKLKEKFEQEREDWQKVDAASDPMATPKSSDDLVDAGNFLVVCRLDEAAMKNSKMRELIAPMKAVINTALPLVPVPPLHEVREKLLFEFPYAEQVIDFALGDLVGRTTVRLRPLLLVGDPGGGKSRFARRLGESLNLGVWRTDASRSDGAVFGGTDKRWYSAEPCHPFLAIAQSKQAGPLVLIDELEKAGTRTDYGRFWDCLLGFLEPETASRYPDPALQTNLDLSQISYVATTNSIDALPSPLRDRFRVITFPKPTAGDLDALLPAVTADLATERGLDQRWVEPLTGFERDAVAAHWRGGSVRRLRRVVEIVLRVRESTAVRN